jgi:hypothetical protein
MTSFHPVLLLLGIMPFSKNYKKRESNVAPYDFDHFDKLMLT